MSDVTRELLIGYVPGCQSRSEWYNTNSGSPRCIQISLVGRDPLFIVLGYHADAKFTCSSATQGQDAAPRRVTTWRDLSVVDLEKYQVCILFPPFTPQMRAALV